MIVSRDHENIWNAKNACRRSRRMMSGEAMCASKGKYFWRRCEMRGVYSATITGRGDISCSGRVKREQARGARGGGGGEGQNSELGGAPAGHLRASRVAAEGVGWYIIT